MRTAALSIALLLGAACPAAAAPASLRDVLGQADDRRANAPPVARFVAGDDETFILDRSHGITLLKFEDSSEIWVLTPSPAPRGDVIYRNDVGEPVLRATKLGGLTLFTPSQPGGAPAAMEGEAGPLRSPLVATASGLLQRLAGSSVRASRAAQRLVPFEATGVSPGDESVFAEAAAIAAEAIAHIARLSDGKTMLDRFKKVRLLSGRRPGVSVKSGIMQITVTPDLGLAGRPSSERIANAVVTAR